MGTYTPDVDNTNDTLGLTQALLADDGIAQTAQLYGLDLIGQDDGAGMRTLLTDGLGSVRQELADGAVQTATTYDPYGKLLPQTGTSGTVYGYTGEQEDAATGLVYLRARYYNPYLNQWLSRDPFPGYSKLPQSQNGYSYVHGNPVRFNDPTGLQCNDTSSSWCTSILPGSGTIGIGVQPGINYSPNLDGYWDILMYVKWGNGAYFYSELTAHLGCSGHVGPFAAGVTGERVDRREYTNFSDFFSGSLQHSGLTQGPSVPYVSSSEYNANGHIGIDGGLLGASAYGEVSSTGNVVLGGGVNAVNLLGCSAEFSPSGHFAAELSFSRDLDSGDFRPASPN